MKTPNHENPPSSEIEAACLYEYMRESQTLTDALNPRTEVQAKRKPPELRSPFWLGFTEEQLFRLMLELHNAGFPKPWKQLSESSQMQLVSLLAKSKERTMRKDMAAYPPVVIEDVAVGEMPDGRLEVSMPILLKRWKRPGR